MKTKIIKIESCFEPFDTNELSFIKKMGMALEKESEKRIIYRKSDLSLKSIVSDCDYIHISDSLFEYQGLPCLKLGISESDYFREVFSCFLGINCRSINTPILLNDSCYLYFGENDIEPKKHGNFSIVLYITNFDNVVKKLIEKGLLTDYVEISPGRDSKYSWCEKDFQTLDFYDAEFKKGDPFDPSYYDLSTAM